MSKERLFSLVDEKQDQYIKTADSIWGYAETRFEEKKSAAALCDLLRKEGFSVDESIGKIPYAFIGSWGSGKPVLGFLGEFDALSGLSQQQDVAVREAIIPGGNGHGCGHQLLGSGALAAAVALRDYIKENKLSATIKYFGCPGEESGSGKAFMAREGAFSGIDAAITWHPGSETMVTTGSSLANIQVYFKFIGRASHAGGSPHLGRSALDAVELMNVGVNYLREHVISEARMHYAVVNTGGKSPNVVQPEAEVLYLIRAPKNNLVKDIYERVCDIARGAALMTSTKLTIQVDKACSNLIPNEVLENIMFENLNLIPRRKPSAAELDFAAEIQTTLSEEEKKSSYNGLIAIFGEKEGRKQAAELLKQPITDAIIPHKTSEKAMSGSTDVSDVSWIIPTVQCNTSCTALNTPGHSWQLVAQGRNHWAHTGMLEAAKAMAGVGLDLILQPDKLEAAKQELAERLSDGAYVCPIPAGIQPSPVK